ncbi:cupin domain-containing protein [Streptomyces ossamyceticus]|uniref:Cupin domain-containing protein n=1 Tax=Streptomyces ossamyceticus TaxID=249581 RepID=A0ABV2UY17_9ACTN
MERRVNAHEVELDPLPLKEEDILAGRPAAAVRTLGDLGGTEFGVWALTVGTVRDVEADEIFVVLEGDATVRFETGESVDLTPGVVVRLRAGERTEWEVRSPLRKLFVAAD